MTLDSQIEVSEKNKIIIYNIRIYNWKYILKIRSIFMYIDTYKDAKLNLLRKWAKGIIKFTNSNIHMEVTQI